MRVSGRRYDVRRATSAERIFDHSVFDVQRVCMSSVDRKSMRCKIDVSWM
jgi:hypothetical protein